MAMIDSSNIIDFSSRSRRVHQNSGKSYDGEGERNLELRGILEVLSAYKGYEGGINCSMCGKLYKSKVCFIKHLWEHSVYWDVFPGDKNHERVLAIQAALILYSHYLGVSQEDADRLRDLLVTSPSAHDAPSTSSQMTPKKANPPLSHVSTTPSKPQASTSLLQYPTTPMRGLTLDRQGPSYGHQLTPVKSLRHEITEPYPMTPPKELEMHLVCPSTPRKDKRKSQLMKMQRTSRRKRRLLME